MASSARQLAAESRRYTHHVPKNAATYHQGETAPPRYRVAANTIAAALPAIGIWRATIQEIDEGILFRPSCRSKSRLESVFILRWTIARDAARASGAG